MSWSLKNFKDMATTGLGIICILAAIAGAFWFDLEWWAMLILGLFGFSLFGLPTPDWAKAIIEGFFSKKKE